MSYNQHIHDMMNMVEGTEITIPSIMGFEGTLMDGKGNVCAYVPDEPVYYNQLTNVKWPSEDGYHPSYSQHYGGQRSIDTNYEQQHEAYTRSTGYAQPQYNYNPAYYYPAQWTGNYNYMQPQWRYFQG